MRHPDAIVALWTSLGLRALTCTVITFCLWGLYFTREDHLADNALRRALVWDYGDFAIFASGAAVGAGFAVFHETATGHAVAAEATSPA